jgi:hypothetical protein
MNTPKVSPGETFQQPSSPLQGRPWKAVINGRKSINGARYAATLTGDIQAAAEGLTIYDVMHSLAAILETNNAEMELPDSFQVTLYPPKIP